MFSHSHRPRPGRRRHQSHQCWLSLCSVLLIVSLLAAPTLGSHMEINEKTGSAAFRWLERRGRIVVDTRPAPVRPDRQRRQEQANPFEGTTAEPLETTTTPEEPRTTREPTSTEDETTTARSSNTDTSVISSPTAKASESDQATGTIAVATSSAAAPTELPSAFDTSLGTNFTTSACPVFFRSFLNNATFQDCHPISLFLQNSNSFFRASRSATSLTAALDASCAASLAECGPLMKSLGTQMIEDTTCGQEYRDENPLVRQAYSGLVSYEPLYQATCLENADTGDYCFVDAITNQTNPSDSYPYYTALGTDLPASTRPTCNTCLQDTMRIFAGYAAQKEQPVSTTYIATAEQIILGCGPGFVNATVPIATISAGMGTYGSLGQASSLLTVMLGLLVVFLTL